MTNITALIFWCLTTNWQDAGQSSTLMWPPEANTITYHERGDVRTNKCARVTVEGHEQVIILEAFSIGTVDRSYTWSKPQRVYGPTFFTWTGPRNEVNVTNWGNLTTNTWPIDLRLIVVTNFSLTNPAYLNR